MSKLPTLESESRRKPKLPPFVILKRALAIFCVFLSVCLIGVTLFGPAEAKKPDENTEIMVWIFMLVPGVVGLWLWGGRDPDAK